MKKLLAFLVIGSLGMFTIGCGEPAKPVKKPDDKKVEDKKPEDKMEGEAPKTDGGEAAKP